MTACPTAVAYVTSLRSIIFRKKACMWPVAETWRRIWEGDGKLFSRPKISERRFFREKFPFSGVKISDDLFYSHRPGFSDFPFLFPDFFRIFTVLNVVYDPFPHKKNTFFTLFILSRASDNTTFQNIGGTNAWAVPHLKFFGDRPPVPLGFRL